MTYSSFQTTLSCTDETSKVETGLSADWVYFAPFQTDTQVTVLLCWALSDLKTPILFLLSFRLNTALHYALLALLSLSTLVFRNNMCHCLSVWDVLIARWAVDIFQFSNYSELHWWDLKGRNRTVCRLSLYIYIYIFLKLIDKHFPKSHIFHKVFNRNNVKVSYSCTSNLRNLIKQHNAKILDETRNANSDGCNCRKRNSCPLDGACLASGIVYKAIVTTNIGQPKIYIGSKEHSFKTRFNNHKISLKYRKRSHSTCLSKYIWELKDKGTDHEIKWSIIKRAKPYSGKPSLCNLCLAEKLCILTADKSVLLKKRSELITKCRHENKLYAANQRPDHYDYPP